MAKITTILFDCDNTLVLSEKLAFEGCADLINEICRTKGVDMSEPFSGDTLESEFVGMNFRGMMGKLQEKFPKLAGNLTQDELDNYVKREEDVVIAKIKAKGESCPGVDAVLEKLAAAGKHTMAVVSSSALRRVQASIEKVGQAQYFGKYVYSAATSLPVPTSKPDPAVYLYAMEQLGKKANECVAVEDSKSGTLSGTRAGIKVIGYVGPYKDEKKDEMEKALRDAGAVIVMRHWNEFESVLEKIEQGTL